MEEEITTIKRLRQAIGAAREIYVKPAFGNSDKWIRTTRKQALILIEGYDETKHAVYYGMTGDIYGTYNEGILSIG